ncbi:MAG: site-2 protease family protein [Thermodesulfobacteriota bacteirum]|nr:site-2 protease family protein [Thermodesulfobacteriota bacterium]
MDLLLLGFTLIFSLTVHEYSHACAALVLGDTTAKDQGRLTLNPLKHLDLVGIMMLFVIGLGWAKPVPVNIENLINKRKSLYIVALAGPLSNIIIAILSTIAFYLTDSQSGYNAFFAYMATINILLALFNLFPIPPLDGSNIIYSFLSDKLAYQYNKIVGKYGNYGFLIIIILFNIYPQIIFSPLSIILKILGLK